MIDNDVLRISLAECFVIGSTGGFMFCIIFRLLFYGVFKGWELLKKLTGDNDVK